MEQATIQKRIKKYSREKPENLPNKQITEKSLAVIDVISRYQIIPTSLLVRLVPGNHRNTQRHLKNLYHQKFINRFAIPGARNPGEFNYYLDSRNALDLLALKGFDEAKLDYKILKNNRDKKYSKITQSNENEAGQITHLQHELMISRFHYMIEKACEKTNGKVELTEFVQGSKLWNNVHAPEAFIDRSGRLVETSKILKLPHRPDAYFALHFPTLEEDQTLYFFYEADRGSMMPKQMKEKFRSHWQYVVKQKLHREHYKIDRVRAVLVEATESKRASQLREHAKNKTVSGEKPSALFWFTTSELLGDFLESPEHIFRKIWATPAQGDELTPEEFLSLID